MNKFALIITTILMLTVITTVLGSDNINFKNTFTQVMASADTYVTSTSPDRNLGNQAEITVWRDQGVQRSIAYIRFDNISTIPSNSIIISASMCVFLFGSIESQTILFSTPTDPWDEYTLTWNNKPRNGPVCAKLKLDEGINYGWSCIDVTTLVHKWYTKTIQNNGLAAVSDGGPSGSWSLPQSDGSFSTFGSAFVRWMSKDEPSFPPYISVEYTTATTITTPKINNILSDTPVSTTKLTASVNLYGERTDVTIGEDIILKLSAVNKITKPTMTVQVILVPPSGMSVTSSEFVISGAGQYTTTYKLAPGDGRNIEIRVKTNQQGDFNVKGEIILYYGDDKSTAEEHTLSLPIKVRETPKTIHSSLPIRDSPTISLWISLLAFVSIAFKFRKQLVK